MAELTREEWRVLQVNPRYSPHAVPVPMHDEQKARDRQRVLDDMGGGARVVRIERRYVSEWEAVDG